MRLLRPFAIARVFLRQDDKFVEVVYGIMVRPNVYCNTKNNSAKLQLIYTKNLLSNVSFRRRRPELLRTGEANHIKLASFYLEYFRSHCNN